MIPKYMFYRLSTPYTTSNNPSRHHKSYTDV